MRLIGHLEDMVRARTFADYLYAQDIDSTVEEEGARWAVWIHNEEQLEPARRLLDEFRADPEDRKYQQAVRTARKKREQTQEDNVAAQKRHFDRATVFATRLRRLGPLTVALIVGCGVVTLLTQFGENSLFSRFFSIVPFEESGRYIRFRGGLEGLLQLQFWRVFTPIFVHMNWLHLVFNLLWLKDLGSLLESRLGFWSLLGLVALTAAPPNIAQFLVHGPGFGGMSGVVYGLFGYLWIRGRLDPMSGLFIDPTSVWIVMGWFFLCLFGVIPNVANTVHAVGLGLGALAGYLAARRSLRR